MFRLKPHLSLFTGAAIALIAGVLLSTPASAANRRLLNVSYDATREFYEDYNAAFVKYWKAKTGQDVSIELSNGGSAKQARAVIDGLDADVVTLGLAYDIDSISEPRRTFSRGLAEPPARRQQPVHFDRGVPGPQGQSQADQGLERSYWPGVAVITPNPKTSGGARWAFLAAWGTRSRSGGNEAKAREFVKALYRNVPVLDSGARGSTTTSSSAESATSCCRGRTRRTSRSTSLARPVRDRLSTRSIVAQPPVAWIDKVDQRHGTTDLAKAYLEYLYSDEGQEIIVRNHFRPTNPAIAAKHRQRPAADRAVHTQAGLRKLGRGPEKILRRRRGLRSDLSAMKRRAEKPDRRKSRWR